MSDRVEKRLDDLESTVSALRQKLDLLYKEAETFLKRYLLTCPACKKEFDLLVNHYSIGLFDNLVYVKCPKCNKSMPVVDKEGGEIGVVSE